ncbi:MAG: crossover junction endodeoxyribonuclease RuvC [Chlamydiales bacterium]|nr:crossover junction endodeoxyribonuclease RuvC [Chlamydiia bacterium]MCP5508014.1 crossover junction endodeoxyribonuclease RuvC [Chlamydiales bacterium]
MGIDPGTRVTGYGIIKVHDNRYEAVDYGCIKPPPALELPDRYLIIYEATEELILRYRPDALAIESQFVHKNVQSALKLGMARGVVIVAARKLGVAIYEYTPKAAKNAVTGRGTASKEQVQGMTQRLLNLPKPPTPADAADALCLAICHAQRGHREQLTLINR